MNPCKDLCYQRYGKQYSKECDKECDFAKAVNASRSETTPAECKTCKYESLPCYSVPCDGCTMGDESNHYVPKDANSDDEIKSAKEYCEDCRAIEMCSFYPRGECDFKIQGWTEFDNPPKEKGYILLSFENFDIPMVGRYEEDDSGGAYYIGDEEEPCVKSDVYVNAWMPLPKPYRED